MSRTLLLLMSCFILFQACRTHQPNANLEKLAADYLITGGQVFVGEDKAAEKLNIAIKDDRIIFVGSPDEKLIEAVRHIDATGLFIAPGFIDPHTHSLGDLLDTNRNANLNYLMQGVTTVVNGNDGGGPLEIGSTLARLDSQGIGTNTLLYTGHNTIRRSVMGMADRAPTQEEMSLMKKHVQKGMEEGAFGLSTGLFYTPGSYSKTEEVIGLAKVAAAKNGIYDSHLRDESSYTLGLLASVEEAIRIGREADIPVHIAHIKALGVDVWGKSEEVIALVENARAEGIKVSADQYPYVASGTSIQASLIPAWVFVGSHKEYQARLRDPKLLMRIRKEMQENLRRRGGAVSLLITGGRDEWRGKTLETLSIENRKDAISMALEIAKAGGASVASFNMNEADLETFMKKPWVTTSSDGSSGHPRKFGSFPLKFQDYVLKKQILPVHTFIYKSSGLVAETLGIAERGYLREGYFADIIVFNPNQFVAKSDFNEPENLAEGVEYVWINGGLVVENGEYKGALLGKPLRNGY